MNRLKEYFSKKTDKEIFAILLFFSCLILMTVLAGFRFCGIGYFANEYEEQEVIPWMQVAIQFVLKWVDLLFVLLILSKAKFYIVAIISLAWNCIYFITMPEIVVMLLQLKTLQAASTSAA